MLTQQTPDPANVAAKHFPPATTNTAAEQLIRRMVAFSPTERPSVSVLLEEVEKIRMSSLPPGQLV
jgi:serine/threonine protein kinase